MTRILNFFGEWRALGVLFALAVLIGGFVVAPFDVSGLGGWTESFPRSPVHVDAIPDTGENQQVVFAAWPGSAPADVEEQLTYPLVSELLGLSGVRTIRSTSAFGFASLYVLFEPGQDFYEARTRLSEKLGSLPDGLLPEGVTPRLGPDATGLGQVFWYVLEPHDAEGRAVEGAFDLHELRTLQDFTVGPALASVGGVAEVSSIGGFVAEWQVDVDLDRLAGYGLGLDAVQAAVRGANLDVSAGLLENNGAEYVLRGEGRLEDPAELESAVVAEANGRTILIRDVARVGLGPASRRGLYDLNGRDAVGGVVVVRYGENPRAVLDGVRARIAEIAPALARRTVDGVETQVRVVPVYDRSQLIDDTVATLGTALEEQLLITALVLMLMLGTVRGALLAAAIPPLGVLLAFMAMRLLGIEANAMSLAGIAIAIGSMIDIGIVFVESVQRGAAVAEAELELESESEAEAESRAGARAGAGAGEKTAADERPVVAALAVVAPAALTSTLTTVASFLPVFALGAGAGKLFQPLAFTKTFALLGAFLAAMVIVAPAARTWMRKRGALGLKARVLFSLPLFALLLLLHQDSTKTMVLLGAGVIGTVLLFLGFEHIYPRLLSFVLGHKTLFVLLPIALLIAGGLGFASLEKDGATPFNEGAFLYMPSTSPHASIATVQRLLRESDAAIAAVPEVDAVLGKAGRVDSALDPAPISMFETMILYAPEYEDVDGERVRRWRDHIHSPADIWAEIARAAARPGLSLAPPLQPIETRQIMLQSGMRGPIGVRLSGPNDEALTEASRRVEARLRARDDVQRGSIQAQQSARVPYMDLRLDRQALAAFGLSAREALAAFHVATQGSIEGDFIEGRTRRAIRVRAERADRQSLAAIEAIPLRGGTVRLGQVAEIVYRAGPAAIRSEDTFETRYLLFSPIEGISAPAAARSIEALLAETSLPEGVSARVTGTFEAELETQRELRVLVPLALLVVFLLVYLQFRNVLHTLFVFAGAFVAMAGGFVTLWLVGDTALTPAVWVGFIALIGIAVDDGVLMMTFIRLSEDDAGEVPLHERVAGAASRRISACLMTTATTLLALLPVLLATGRGSDLMTPMAYPLFGGMAFELLTLFVVPTLYCAHMERRRQDA